MKPLAFSCPHAISLCTLPLFGLSKMARAENPPSRLSFRTVRRAETPHPEPSGHSAIGSPGLLFYLIHQKMSEIPQNVKSQRKPMAASPPF